MDGVINLKIKEPFLENRIKGFASIMQGRIDVNDIYCSHVVSTFLLILAVGWFFGDGHDDPMASLSWSKPILSSDMVHS